MLLGCLCRSERRGRGPQDSVNLTVAANERRPVGFGLWQAPICGATRSQQAQAATTRYPRPMGGKPSFGRASVAARKAVRRPLDDGRQVG